MSFDQLYKTSNFYHDTVEAIQNRWLNSKFDIGHSVAMSKMNDIALLC